MKIISKGKRKYIYFGSYPQTIKNSLVRIESEEPNSKGYYLGNDGELYEKVKADPFRVDNVFSQNEIIVNGLYYYFKVEPIKWRILKETETELTIMCNNLIDTHIYDESSNKYETSSIRKWLNNEFLNKAFTKDEMKLILDTTVDNSEESTGLKNNNNISSNTIDKAFLLSYKEITSREYGFLKTPGELHSRVINGTDYSAAKYLYQYERDGWYFLRSPNNCDRMTQRYVYFDGLIGIINITYRDGGVAPVMRIKYIRGNDDANQ